MGAQTLPVVARGEGLMPDFWRSSAAAVQSCLQPWFEPSNRGRCPPRVRALQSSRELPRAWAPVSGDGVSVKRARGRSASSSNLMSQWPRSALEVGRGACPRKHAEGSWRAGR